MSDDQAVRDRTECERLAISCYSLMDRSRYEDSAALFAEDGVWMRGDPAKSPAGILASLMKRPAERLTRHLISNIVVTLTGPDEAEAIGNFVALHGTRVTQGAAKLPQPLMVGDLTYRFRRGADGWRIIYLETTPVFVP